MKLFIDCTILAGYPSGGPVYVLNLLREFFSTNSGVEVHTGFKGINLAHRRRFELMVNSLVQGPIHYDYKFIPGRLYFPRPRIMSHIVNFSADRYDIAHFPASLSLPSTYFDSYRRAVLTVYDAYPLYRDDHLTPLYRDYWRKQLPLQARNSAAIITISRHAKEDLCRHIDIDPDKIFVIPLASQWANTATGSHASSDVVERLHLVHNKYFLAVGSLRPNKNYPHLIRAFNVFHKSSDYSGEHLVIVGNRHRDDQAIHEMIKNNPAIIRVHGVSENDLHALYCNASGFFMISEREGFGIPLLEAMACGCPSCYSAGSAMEEIGRDTAISVDPYDTASVCAIFRRFAERGPDITRRIAAGLDIAKEYTWERTARETLKVYDIARHA